MLGAALPAPVAGHVQRWGGALPQYAARPHRPGRPPSGRRCAPSHPTLALAGAGYDGVGIPVCVRSGEHAAEEILEALGGSGP